MILPVWSVGCRPLENVPCSLAFRTTSPLLANRPQCFGMIMWVPVCLARHDFVFGSPQSSTAGALALADIDGDGDLDLFVGGRVIPGRFPEPASSRIFRNVGGRLETDADNSHRLAKIGLVSGAVFSDLDGDGHADLALACEWGSIRVFRNDAGQFNEVTAELGLDQYRGWWNGITTGDFDGDGRLDLVASNWGRNTKYQRYRAPLRIYYGDFRDD